MYPNETAEHHRDHRCRIKEVNQFCYDSISKYRGNLCGCIARHHRVWAGSRSRVSRHLSLHLSIRGDEVRVRSCLIFRYRIRPKKQCILEKHSNLLQKYNSCRSLLPITHKYLSSHETRKNRHIFARVAAFWQRVFQTLPNLDVHPGVAVYHTLKIFSIVNAKDLLMPHTKFQVCTLKINAIFCHREKKSHYFWTGVYISDISAVIGLVNDWTFSRIMSLFIPLFIYRLVRYRRYLDPKFWSLSFTQTWSQLYCLYIFYKHV